MGLCVSSLNILNESLPGQVETGQYSIIYINWKTYRSLRILGKWTRFPSYQSEMVMCFRFTSVLAIFRSPFVLLIWAYLLVYNPLTGATSVCLSGSFIGDEYNPIRRLFDFSFPTPPLFFSSFKLLKNIKNYSSGSRAMT